MKKSLRARTLVIGLTLLAATAQAQTTIFASGKLYGGPAQTLANCYLYNAGTTAITLTGLGVRNQLGAREQPSTNTCTTSLAGGQGCQMQAYIFNDEPWDCSVGVSSTTDLRGSLEIRQYYDSGTAVVLQSQPMR